VLDLRVLGKPAGDFFFSLLGNVASVWELDRAPPPPPPQALWDGLLNGLVAFLHPKNSLGVVQTPVIPAP
jgi:hypothetical protein